MELKSYFEKNQQRINERLNELVPACASPYKKLFECAKYSLNTPAKRLRPLLTMTVTAMLQGNEKGSLDAACALELIHTYSLIHDDLPCMDNDDFRRGKPTLHKIETEGIAVLTGDFLLTQAFEVLANSKEIPDSQKLELIKVLAKSAGGDGMIAGQIMDIEAENKQITFERLQMIHEKKTGALIAASLEFGAIISNAPNTLRKELRAYGETIGLAFQIVDDLLDITAPKQKHGKSSSDIANNKCTYVSLLGYEKAKEIANNLVKKAKNHLQILPYNTSVLENITDYIIQRTY